MMGRSHATSGALLGLAAVPVVNFYAVPMGLPPIAGYGILVSMVAGAGGAMDPDLDHASASGAQSLGFVTKVLCGLVGFVFGGHRNGTHSFVGIAFFTAVTWLLGVQGGWVFGLWLAFQFAVAASAMRVNLQKNRILHTVLCLLFGVALVHFTGTSYVPVYAATVGVGLGCLAHILGDMLTKEGAPLFWPVSKRRYRFATLTTGDPWETWLYHLMLFATAGCLVWTFITPEFRLWVVDQFEALVALVSGLF